MPRLKSISQFALILYLFLLIPTITQSQSPKLTGKISPFGIGADDLHSRDLRPWIPQMAAIGLQNHRACRTLWPDVEPQENQWRWTQLDDQLTYLASEHIECWGFFYGGVDWNKKDKPGGFPSNNLEAWKRYVYETVKHANGRIRYWELWNEPPNGTNNAPPAEYGKLTAATWEALKSADPSAKLGIAAQSVNLNYLYQAMPSGARNHFDFVTLHPYETMGSVEDQWGTEAVFMHIVSTTRKLLADQSPAQRDAPIWFTEIGYDAGKSPQKQADALIKAYAMGIAQGIEAINWFESMDGDSGPMGLLQANGKPRPAYTALKTLIQQLGPHPEYLGWIMIHNKDCGFLFRNGSKTTLIAWAPGAINDHIYFGQQVDLIHPSTGQSEKSQSAQLTTSPIVIQHFPAKLIAKAQQNKTKPYPWNGDYTNAQSVSVQMGAKTEEKGLHAQQGEAIQANVVAYGGGARAGNVAGGPVFIVDPNFLSYSTTPTEITAQVRRTPENKPAHLVLEYESTSGFRKLPAYEIPAETSSATPNAASQNEQWHTAHFRINDAQFVSKWVFNFRFDMGNYYIQSVEVKKLPE